MNVSAKIAAIAFAAMPIIALAADAEQKLKCSEMVYSIEFLDNFPRSPAACQDVVVRDGQKYAHFRAEVISLKKGNHLTVSFKNAVGDSLGRITFALRPEANLTIDGKKMKPSTVVKGQMLDVWIPESRMGFFAAPGASELNVVSRSAG